MNQNYPASGIRVFADAEIAEALSLTECIAEVEKAFILLAEGKVLDNNLMHLNAEEGEFHVKGGVMKYGEEEAYFGLKANGRFAHNQARYRLPNISGMIYLSDATKGQPLAVFDSAYITRMRTGAATAVAVKYLTLPDARQVTICGAGVQGKIQLEAIAQVRPIEKAYYYDSRPEAAAEAAQAMQAQLGIEVTSIDRPELGTRESDIIVTCTPARKAYITREMIPNTAFVAAVGTDSPGKQELAPDLVLNSYVVADLRSQVVQVGELQYQPPEKISEILLGELHEFVSGQKQRPTVNRPIIFDSTGTAIQDIAAAVAVWKQIPND
ncbi:MAG: ornithine cyclodeaminase family protein [Bacteroidota bacterium]